MSEYTNIPASPACGQWETLLAEALDGLLKPADEAIFTSHKDVCPACAALFEEARRGREWLEFLAAEPEVPAGLLDKILARTGPGQPAAGQAAGYGLLTGSQVAHVPPVSIPAWQRPGFMGQVRRFAEARLMMTAAMAFFSITMTLNLTGVRLNRLSWSDLKPSALYHLPGTARSFVERQVTMASVPVIRYYDHMRLVYEVQTTMRELRRTTETQQERQSAPPAAPGESKKTPGRKDGGSRVDPPQQSITPGSEPSLMDTESEEALLSWQERPAHSGGSPMEVRERSTPWTA